MENVGKNIGETFPAELTAAGLAGLPFAWGSDGSLEVDNVTPQQRAAILAVAAAHDASKLDAAAERSRRMIAQGVTTEAMAAALFDKSMNNKPEAADALKAKIDAIDSAVAAAVVDA